MHLGEFTTQRLMKLNNRWLDLNNRYRRVFHCCARQDGQVRLYEQPNDRSRPALELGNVAADVYCSQFPHADESAESQFQFETGQRSYEFRRSLHIALWRVASLRILTPQDTVLSHLHSDDEASPIVLTGQDGRWSGACVFEKRWDDKDVSSRTLDWYEEAGALAAESLQSFDIKVAPGGNHVRLLESWLAKVYCLLGFDVRSSTVRTSCVDLAGARFTGERRNCYFVGSGKPSRVYAEALSSLTWLTCDLATSSAMAIELLVDRNLQSRDSIADSSEQVVSMLPIQAATRSKGKVLAGPVVESETDAIEMGLLGLKDCLPSEVKAWSAWMYAVKIAGDFKNMPLAYEWLEDNFDPNSENIPSSLYNYELPSFDTWSRQVRAARKATQTQVNQKRADRAYGKSIVRGAEI